MAAGTPKDETQPCEKASRTNSVEISFIVIAVGNRVILSTIVSKYGKPFEVGTHGLKILCFKCGKFPLSNFFKKSPVVCV